MTLTPAGFVRQTNNVTFDQNPEVFPILRRFPDNRIPQFYQKL
jgi:hypothetical protein